MYIQQPNLPIFQNANLKYLINEHYTMSRDVQIEPRNYYYLVSGLPDLIPEQGKIPFTPAAFIELLRDSLHPDDFREVTWLLYPADHENLLDLLQKRECSWRPLSVFSREEMEERLQEPGRLPAYLERFLHAYREETPVWPHLNWENQLTRLYLEATPENTQGFVRRWLVFDNQLRNVLSAWNSREYNYPLEGQIVGQNEVAEAIERSPARDFGLSGEFPFVDKLLHALEQDSLLEREKAIDRIRWNYIDDLNTFQYFTIDVILGYLLKLTMLDRWRRLEPERGKAAVDNLIEELENSFVFPANFTIA